MRHAGPLLIAVAAASLVGHSLAQDARKGTRNYVPADPAAPKVAKEADAKVNTLEGSSR